jgi:Leucine rich repeat variant
MMYHGPKERREAAQASDTPAVELGRLAQSEHIFVREAVAANPGTPGEVLASMLPDELSSEDDFRIALSLVRNPTLRSELASGVAALVVQAVARIGPRDFYPTELIDALVRCSVVPAESLLSLAEPESVPKYIRGRIAAPAARPEVLARLCEDPSEKVRSRARRAVEMSE